MKHSTCFLLLGALMAPALGAQSVAENRAYLRLGGAYHMNDMKAYLGDRTFSPVYEFGYDFKGPTESTGFGLYVSYITGHGDPMSKYKYFVEYDDEDEYSGRPIPNYLNNGMKQMLFGWRLGGDLRYRTPLKGLTLFMGFSANWWDGQRREPGTVQDIDDYENFYVLEAGSKSRWPEGKAKVGWRIGAEYRITKNWGVCWDTSVSSWMSRDDSLGQGQQTLTSDRAYKGINPVNPSWMNFSVQYRWSMFD